MIERLMIVSILVAGVVLTGYYGFIVPGDQPVPMVIGGYLMGTTLSYLWRTRDLD